MNTPQFIIDELNAGMDGFTLTSVSLPNIGDAVLVKFRYGAESGPFYAIYSDENEFDVHKPKQIVGEYRKAWFKFSKSSIKSWVRVEQFVKTNKP